MKYTLNCVACMLCTALLLLSGCKQPATTPPQVSPPSPAKTDLNKFILPAEFEEQDAVWLLWPQVEHRNGMHNHDVVIDIIRSIQDVVPIKMVVSNDSVLQVAKKLIPAALQNPEKLTFIQLPYQEFWARDMGPVFLRNGKGEMAMADFGFTDWGYGDSTMADVKMDEKLDENLGKKWMING